MLWKQYKNLFFALLCLAGLILSIIIGIDYKKENQDFDAFIKIVRAFLFLVFFIHYALKFRKQQAVVSDQQ